MKYDRNEIVAGIFVLVCMFLLLGLIFKAGNFKESFQPKTEITVKFSNARGVKLNSAVYYAGVKSGAVSKITVDEQDNVYITLRLAKGVNIKRNSDIKIGANVMGDSYIEITPGKGDIVQSGETIQGSDASITQQIEEVVSSIKDLVSSDKITSSLDSLDKTLKNVATISETVANDKDQIKTIISNVNGITQSLNRDLDGITGKLNTVLANISEMTDTEQIQKVDQITGNIVKITDNMENILAENRKSIKDIATNVETITDNLYILSADLKRHPWKMVWKSKEEDVEKYALQDAIVGLKEAESNLKTLSEKNEKVSDADLAEIRALIQNLQTIQKSTKELTTQQQQGKAPVRKPVGR